MEAEKKTNKVFEDDAFKPVPEDAKHGWWRTSFNWAGSSICVPTIMVGAMLIENMSFAEMIISVLLGTCLLSVVFCLQSSQGEELGLPTVVIARSSFGKEGAGIIISFILAITLMCWAGSDCQIAGESFIQILELNDIHWNRNATIIILGLIMLTVSIVGEKFISVLNTIAVPGLILLCIYGIVTCWNSVDYIDLFKNSEISAAHLFEGTTTAFGMQAVGSVISPDYGRFNRSIKEACLGVTVGIIPYCLFLFIAGAIMGQATGEQDISLLVAKLGLPIIGLIILVLATWTTMASDAYFGGLAITSLFHLSGTKRAVATGISGCVGIGLAVFGIMDHFWGFLDTMATCIPPVAGIMIADFWIMKKGKVDRWKELPGINWFAVIALAVAVLAALYIPYGFPTINGIVIAGVLHIVLSKFNKNYNE